MKKTFILAHACAMAAMAMASHQPSGSPTAPSYAGNYPARPSRGQPLRASKYKLKPGIKL